jgi:hypothetical protein
MADFNTLVTDVFSGSTPVSNGVDKLYNVSGKTVQEWDLATGLSTSLDQVGDDNDGLAFVAWFKGALYALWTDESPFDVGISVWDGDSWSRVWTPDPAINSALATGIWATASQLVALPGAYENPGSVRQGCVYSSNGSSWSQGTVEGDSGLILIPDGPVLTHDSIYLKGSSEHLNPLADAHLYRWSGSDWVNVVDSFGSMFSGTPYPYLIAVSWDKFWRFEAATPETRYAETVTGSWTTTPDNESALTMLPVYQINMPRTYGAASGFSFLQAWLDDTEEWEAGVFDTWVLATYGSNVQFLVRVASGDVYMGVQKASPFAYNLLKRSAPLPFSEDPNVSKFYQGVEGLTLRSSLPFKSVRPGNMAVRGDGKVAIGNGGGTGPAVVTGQAGDNYATWTDRTGNHPALTNGVVWINGE